MIPAALLLLAVSAPPQLVPRMVSAERSNCFGTQTTCLQEGHESGRLPQFVGEIAATGFGWVKDWIGGGQVRPGEELAARWGTVPEHWLVYLRTCRELRLRVLLRVDWPRYDGREPSSPAGLAAVAAYYEAMARQLGGWVDDWEIDNEPNIGNERPRVSPADCAAITAVAAAALRRGDPGCRVYGPATAMLQCLHTAPYPWVDRAVAAGLLESLDVFSFHPYRQPYRADNVPEHASEFHPWTVWGSYEQQLTDLRARLAAAGRPLPLAATEEGYPTTTNRATGQREISYLTQAKYEARAMILDFALGVRPRINFIYKRPWSDPHEDEHQFNLVNADGLRRPAWQAAQNVCAVLDDSLRPAGPLRFAAPPEAHANGSAYTRPDGALVVLLWAAVPAVDAPREWTAQVTLPRRAQRAVAYDLLAAAPVPGRELAVDGDLLPAVPLRDGPLAVVVDGT
ncbi:MAG: hypothetical protein IT204_16290 [Fimbriimonadaceae bacterium]|nr:hypothetical protein [Fimbriimonadaceae bacterium]